MKKFDLIFEKALNWLNEENAGSYSNSTLFDSIYVLSKLLSSKNNNYLINKKVNADDNQSVMRFAQEISKQKTPTITLDTNPPISIIPSQVPDTEDFTVEIIDASKKMSDPARSKKIVNSHNEAIFDEVMDFIKTATMKEASPEAAITELPQEENPAQAQPGAEQSALPKA
jgi:hypothetical protein